MILKTTSTKAYEISGLHELPEPHSLEPLEKLQ